MRSFFRRISARESGFTLVEVVIATGLLLMVTGSIMGVYSTMQRASVRQQSRSEALDHLRIAMERMTKDIRQATAVRAGSDADYLEIDTYVNGVEERIVYDGSDGATLRRITPDTTIALMEDLASTAIFTYVPDLTAPTVVQIDLRIRPKRFLGDADFIDLTSEVRLRNI